MVVGVGVSEGVGVGGGCGCEIRACNGEDQFVGRDLHSF